MHWEHDGGPFVNSFREDIYTATTIIHDLLADKKSKTNTLRIIVLCSINIVEYFKELALLYLR